MLHRRRKIAQQQTQLLLRPVYQTKSNPTRPVHVRWLTNRKQSLFTCCPVFGPLILLDNNPTHKHLNVHLIAPSDHGPNDLLIAHHLPANFHVTSTHYYSTSLLRGLKYTTLFLLDQLVRLMRIKDFATSHRNSWRGHCPQSRCLPLT